MVVREVCLREAIQCQESLSYRNRNDAHPERLAVKRNRLVDFPAPRASANGRRISLRVGRHPTLQHLAKQVRRQLTVFQLHACVQGARVRVLQARQSRNRVKGENNIQGGKRYS